MFTNGPIGVAARLSHELGVTVVDGQLVCDDDDENLQLYTETNTAQWAHQLRDRCRQAVLRPAVRHRTAFQPLLKNRVDWARSLALVRLQRSNNRFRSSLEVALSDGMLTAQRTGKGGHRRDILCPLCGTEPGGASLLEVPKMGLSACSVGNEQSYVGPHN